MRALKVSIDGRRVGLYVPPEGAPFAAMIANIPRKYMRAHITSGTSSESWQWQLPDIQLGQTISFRMVEAEPGSGIAPQFVRRRTRDEIVENKRLAAEAYQEAGRASSTRGGQGSNRRLKGPRPKRHAP